MCPPTWMEGGAQPIPGELWKQARGWPNNGWQPAAAGRSGPLSARSSASTCCPTAVWHVTTAPLSSPVYRRGKRLSKLSHRCIEGETELREVKSFVLGHTAAKREPGLKPRLPDPLRAWHASSGPSSRGSRRGRQVRAGPKQGDCLTQGLRTKGSPLVRRATQEGRLPATTILWPPVPSRKQEQKG